MFIYRKTEKQSLLLFGFFNALNFENDSKNIRESFFEAILKCEGRQKCHSTSAG